MQGKFDFIREKKQAITPSTRSQSRKILAAPILRFAFCSLWFWFEDMGFGLVRCSGFILMTEMTPFLIS